MLGISQRLVKEIAEQPTEHSWMVELMKLEPWEIEEAEENLLKWAKTLTKDENAASIVFKGAPYLLEWKAIEKFMGQHWDMYWIIPEMTTPGEVVEIMNADMNGMYSKESLEEANRLLTMIQEGQLKPDLQTLMPSEEN